MGGDEPDDLCRCPDGKHTFDETLEIGDRVAYRGSFSSTHTGDLMGIPPTGKKITITFMNIDRSLRRRQARRARFEGDMLGLMQQLGAIPS